MKRALLVLTVFAAWNCAAVTVSADYAMSRGVEIKPQDLQCYQSADDPNRDMFHGYIVYAHQEKSFTDEKGTPTSVHCFVEWGSGESFDEINNGSVASVTLDHCAFATIDNKYLAHVFCDEDQR